MGSPVILLVMQGADVVDTSLLHTAQVHVRLAAVPPATMPTAPDRQKIFQAGGSNIPVLELPHGSWIERLPLIGSIAPEEGSALAANPCHALGH